MPKKILLLRADELRHRALSYTIQNSGHEVYEIIQKRVSRSEVVDDDLIKLHFQMRQEVERNFFSDLIKTKSDKNLKTITCSDVNSHESIQFAKKLDIDLVITFGCSILKKPWLKLFKNKILGIHLGLSPYYRGHGTNFFPFVNNELGAVGYTLMNLNEGVDTGDIFHQSYAHMYSDDNIHTVGTRLIYYLLNDIVKIINLEKFNLSSAVTQPHVIDFKLYRKLDFNRINLEVALSNIKNGSIKSFSENIEEKRKRFPLIRAIDLDVT